MNRVRAGLRARDVMTREPLCVDPTTTLPELARLLQEHEITGAPVLDREGRVIGVVSKTDLIRRCSEGESEWPPAYLFETLGEQSDDEADADIVPERVVCVEEFMTTEPEVVSPDTPLSTVIRLMLGARIHRVVVVDADSFPVGIITTLDVLGRLAGGGGRVAAQRSSRPFGAAERSDR